MKTLIQKALRSRADIFQLGAVAVLLALGVNLLHKRVTPIRFANSKLESQRDSIPQPRVGPSRIGEELPCVIGSVSVIGALPVGVTGISLPDSTIQNGGPDGVLLFNATNNGILDAFSYEGSITAGIVTGVPTTFNLVEGTVLATSTQDSNTIVGSLSRLPNGADSNNANTDWVFTSTPTPGTANMP